MIPWYQDSFGDIHRQTYRVPDDVPTVPPEISAQIDSETSYEKECNGNNQGAAARKRFQFRNMNFHSPEIKTLDTDMAKQTVVAETRQPVCLRRLEVPNPFNNSTFPYSISNPHDLFFLQLADKSGFRDLPLGAFSRKNPIELVSTGFQKVRKGMSAAP